MRDTATYGVFPCPSRAGGSRNEYFSSPVKNFCNRRRDGVHFRQTVHGR